MRRIGLDGPWAALAALTATVPALVYGYELIGSVKEITSLGMILTLGALVVLYPRWLRGRRQRRDPVRARGGRRASPRWAWVRRMGAGGGGGPRRGDGRRRRAAARRAAARGVRSLRLIGVGAIVACCSPPCRPGQSCRNRWMSRRTSPRTGNPGNLRTPLQTLQVFGVWLWSTYKHPPAGADLAITDALIAVAVRRRFCSGALRLIRTRDYPLAGWLALTLLVWLARDARTAPPGWTPRR